MPPTGGPGLRKVVVSAGLREPLRRLCGCNRCGEDAAEETDQEAWLTGRKSTSWAGFHSPIGEEPAEDGPEHLFPASFRSGSVNRTALHGPFKTFSIWRLNRLDLSDGLHYVR